MKNLSDKLREMHQAATKGEKVAAVHLFGIRYAEVLKSFSVKQLSEIAEEAGLSPKYGTELRKMVRLSDFVTEK